MIPTIGTISVGCAVQRGTVLRAVFLSLSPQSQLTLPIDHTEQIRHRDFIMVIEHL
jgi:hypothetical protein